MKHRNRHGKWNRRAVVLPLAVMALMIGMAIAGARGHRAAAPMASFTVDNTSDSGAGSLRDAIAAAAPGDTINFSLPPASTITLTTGELLINKNLTIVGPGATSLTISGNNNSHVFQIGVGITVDMSGLTISNGKGSGGGGIVNLGTLTITNSTVSGNTANPPANGGGISNGGTLTLTNSTVSGNTAGGEGGGIFTNGTLTLTNSTVSGNTAVEGGGGGIRMGGDKLTITNSTVSDNTAVEGGGILLAFGANSITNSTVSDNTATFGGGGGIFNQGLAQFGPLKITNSTMSGNSAPQGGGIYNDATFGSTVDIKNSIVANSSLGGNCFDLDNQPFNAVGTNFSTDGSCSGFYQVTAAQLNLLPLALYAPGATATHALGPGSVAIDAVAVGDCTDLSDNPVTLTEDQRGVPRPDGNGNVSAHCDAGSFEALCPTCGSYNFTGFFQPVDNLPTINSAKAGAPIPVKFSLGGNQGLDIFGPGFPVSQMIPCDDGVSQSEIEETATAGNSGLNYDPTSNQYTYVWKTDKAWKDTCRQLILSVKNGSVQIALFKFK